MARLVILQGPPCSGKTTRARAEVEAKPAKRVIVSRDALRHALGDYWVPEREGLVATIEEFAITEALKRDFTVICDGTNLDPARYQGLRKIADRLDLPTETISLYCSFPEAVRRNANPDREHHIEEDALRQFYMKYFPAKYAEEIAADPGPYLTPSNPQAAETRLITDADGEVIWTPTREDLQNLRKLAALRFPITSIAISLEVPESEVRRHLATPQSPAYNAYHSGKVEAEILYRDRIRRAAESGDIDAIKLLEEWSIAQTKEELGFQR